MYGYERSLILILEILKCSCSFLKISMSKLGNSTGRPVQLYSPINNSAPPRRRGLSQLSDLVLDLLHTADTGAGSGLGWEEGGHMTN